MREQGYDYVIAGGGSAGCVLAARLSENPDLRVLLLEAGGGDWHPLVHVPVGFARMSPGRFAWGLVTTPQSGLHDRRIEMRQARVIGGGSSINAQIYTRGHPSDFDRWASDEGAAGWSFADVRRYFLKAEGYTGPAGDWHGTGGPLAVTTPEAVQPVSRAFLRACEEAGITPTGDFNGPSQAGCGLYQTTTRNRRRCSTAIGYLRAARGRPNLTVETGCLVQRILMRGTRATGVAYRRGNRDRIARAESEVIVTSGAIGSPKLLMLSGIGPAAHLREHGIEVACDLPGVGENLQDHLGVDLVAELRGDGGLDRYKAPHRAALAALRYALFRDGPAASTLVESGAFWFSDPERGGVPDIQLHLVTSTGTRNGVPTVPRGASGITLNTCIVRPRSRGTVRLRSGNAAEPPLVDPGYLTHPEDLAPTIAAARLAHEILRQPGLHRHIRAIRHPETASPTDTDLETWIRSIGRSAYHPACSCRIGTDTMAVVDPHLRVHGVEGLRVCDSAAMPSLIGSNTNATTVMIAEKAADLIRGNR